ncbi:MAG: Mobile element protein [Edaphobacter sp.]|nr:Mobile element protein [Edaphobacter sp.]
MPARFVKPYVKTNKNDYLGAEAIAEAVQRPTMRFVPIKTDEQLNLQALRRVRDRWVARCTAVMNQMRGFARARHSRCARGFHPLMPIPPLARNFSTCASPSFHAGHNGRFLLGREVLHLDRLAGPTPMLASFARIATSSGLGGANCRAKSR